MTAEVFGAWTTKRRPGAVAHLFEKEGLKPATCTDYLRSSAGHSSSAEGRLPADLRGFAQMRGDERGNTLGHNGCAIGRMTCSVFRIVNQRQEHLISEYLGTK